MVVQAGGTPAVLKYLMEKGLIDGACLTVTGASPPLHPPEGLFNPLDVLIAGMGRRTKDPSATPGRVF